jgi:hypothetical protein
MNEKAQAEIDALTANQRALINELTNTAREVNARPWWSPFVVVAGIFGIAFALVKLIEHF